MGWIAKLNAFQLFGTSPQSEVVGLSSGLCLFGGIPRMFPIHFRWYDTVNVFVVGTTLVCVESAAGVWLLVCCKPVLVEGAVDDDAVGITVVNACPWSVLLACCVDVRSVLEAANIKYSRHSKVGEWLCSSDLRRGKHFLLLQDW
jgi:hypothetical protein